MVRIRDTRLGAWLRQNAPQQWEVIKDLVPDRGVIGVVKRLVDDHRSTTPEVQEMLREWEREVTQRWESDAQHKLTRSVRPLVVLVSVASAIGFAIAEGMQLIVLKPAYIDLLQSLVMTSVGGYFVLRTADKWQGGKG